MTVLDHQWGLKMESTYGTPVVVDRFMEFTSESLKPEYPRLMSSSRRPGQAYTRSDRTARPGFTTVGGSIKHVVLSKQWGLVPKLAFGTVATSGPAETTVYTHTYSVTAGNLTGVSATMQLGKAFTDGTVQPLTYAGVKSSGLTLATGIGDLLMCDLNVVHASAEATATALASATYPSGAEVFSYVGGALTVDAGAVPVSAASFTIENNYAKRPKLGNAPGLEPLETSPGRRVSCSFAAEFTSMSLLNKVRATTAAGGQAAIVLSWQAPTLIGTTLFPKITITIPVLEVLGDFVNVDDIGNGVLQVPINGEALVNTSGVLATLAYQTTDTTP